MTWVGDVILYLSAYPAYEDFRVALPPVSGAGNGIKPCYFTDRRSRGRAVGFLPLNDFEFGHGPVSFLGALERSVGLSLPPIVSPLPKNDVGRDCNRTALYGRRSAVQDRKESSRLCVATVAAGAG